MACAACPTAASRSARSGIEGGIGNSPVDPCLFSPSSDRGHCRNGFDRESADGRFRRKHDSIATIQNRIGNVGSFRPGRLVEIDHRLQHLRSRNHRHSLVATDRDDPLLSNRDILETHFEERDPLGQPSRHNTRERCSQYRQGRSSALSWRSPELKRLARPAPA